jgi:hypothetical protein
MFYGFLYYFNTRITLNTVKYDFVNLKDFIKLNDDVLKSLPKN